MSLPITIQRSIDDLVRGFNAANVGNTMPVEAVLAVADVESNGVPYQIVDGEKRPTILFEPHIFYRRLTGAARADAVKLNLASKKQNRALYGETQADRWNQIAQAQDLLERHGLSTGIALECASFGVGQVMGYHWSTLGYSSVEDFYRTVTRDIAGQVEAMLRYIVVNDLDDELRDGRWAAFARGYNGVAYAQNKYDTKLAAAAIAYGGKATPADGMLRLGSKGARVRELQTLLVRAGYQVKVDGDFGPSTKATLKQFQTASGLTADGVYGPKTETTLAHFRQSSEERPGQQKPTEVKEVVEGAGGIGGGVVIEAVQNKVDAATTSLQAIDGFQPWLGYGLAALSMIALALALFGAYRAAKGWLNSLKTVEV